MGVFDYIRCDLPLPDPKPPVEWFQTKDVPTDQLYLEKWIIRDDGMLVKLGVRYEDRSDPKEEGLMRFAGMMTPVSAPELDRAFDDFHGDISFGHYVPETREDWEYTARFSDGKCTSIKLDYRPPGANA